DGLRLAFETLLRLGAVRKVRREDLDRDRPLEPRVARLVDLAHASGADRGQDLVGTEASSRSERHGLRRFYPANREAAPPSVVVRLGALPPGRVVRVDDAVLHHDPDALDLGDVLQRTAGYGHEVRELARLDRPDAVGPAEDLGVQLRRGDDR